jgi:7,8-dihydropterin-6-yl-methyl-4-(beta-D-ribofuranosyl)aminobenzene 5'-phosphate synthase
MNDKTMKNTEITIIYDNYEYDNKLSTGWCFSCLIRDKNILFDTGCDSSILLDNMKNLGISPKEIDSIVLSHIHGDHTGGLTGVLEINPNVTVYVPQSFPVSFKDEIKSYGSNVMDISDPTKICNGVYSTGEMGTWIKEQALMLRTEKGLVIITGCAHPGVVDMIKRAKEVTKESIYLVIGGFHLGGASDADLMQIINAFRELGVKKVGPCHCSGNRCRELFEEEYGDDFVEVGVGKIIEV